MFYCVLFFYLVDEIDTTIFVINDKILNKELRGYNGGFEEEENENEMQRI
jgi:hypothetical protein